MRELFETILPSWCLDFIHLPYMVFVWLAVEWIRYQIDNVDTYIKPKHLTLIIGMLAALALHFGEAYFESVEVKPHVLLASFLITTWFYEYGVKIIKDNVPLFKKIKEKQEN